MSPADLYAPLAEARGITFRHSGIFGRTWEAGVEVEAVRGKPWRTVFAGGDGTNVAVDRLRGRERDTGRSSSGR